MSNNYDSIFGNQDRGYENLIKNQANTVSRLDIKKEHNVKKLVKDTKLNKKNTRRVNNQK